MAEPTLQLTYADLASEVGYYLGFGRTSDGWTEEQTAYVDSCVQSGLRQFYAPPPRPPTFKPHVWGFLRPVTTLQTVAGQGDYDLPDDFGGIVGQLTFGDTEHLYPPVKIVGEAQIRAARQRSSLTSRPMYAALRPKAPETNTPQGWELLLDPTPDGVYTLTYRYNVELNKLSISNGYPPGGQYHAETILASCLAVAESRVDAEATGRKKKEWLERLDASIAFDVASREPEYLGYNGDGSDCGPARRAKLTYVKYNGVLYSY